MRWFLSRLAFYVFALWLALTLSFLLPRIMPGNPIGGILQHLSPDIPVGLEVPMTAMMAARGAEAVVRRVREAAERLLGS